MAANTFVYVTLCFLAAFNSIDALHTENGKIKITVGTTSGCGDTVNFISTQLAETYRDFKEFLEIKFVPWGRTVRNEDDSLICQFGPNDCWANRLHRCSLDLLKDNQDAQVDYMACEFSSPHPGFLQGSYACALAAGLNQTDVVDCVNISGRPLDDAAQEAAREPMQEINFVPSINFFDIIDLGLHNEARSKLRLIVCLVLSSDPSTGVNFCYI